MRPGLPYLAVRCHGLRGHLIDPPTMKALVKAEDIEKLVEILLKTDYREEIRLVPLKEITGFALERLFNEKLIKRCYFIADIAPRGPGEFLRAYFRRFEIQNIKRILRGKISRIHADQIRSELLPVERYSHVSFQALLKAEDIEQIMALLGETVYAAVVESLALYKKYKSLLPVEAHLERIYFEEVWKSLGKLPRGDREDIARVLGAMVDLENCFAVLGGKMQNLDESLMRRLVLPHGHALPKATIDDMILEDDARSAASLLRAPYVEIVKPILDGDSVLARARGFRYVIKEALRIGRWSTYRFAFVFLYTMLAEAENRDLISIALGKESHAPPELIAKYLISSI